MIGEEVMNAPTEAESLRQQLLQAQRLSTMGTLASSVAHEFNNILTTIINYAKLGLRPQTDEPQPHRIAREDPEGQPSGSHHRQQHARLRPQHHRVKRQQPTWPT